MVDKMMGMFGGSQAQEALFRFMAGQVAQAPPEKRAALARVEVAIVRKGQQMSLAITDSDDPQVAQVISGSLDNWGALLSKAFQAMGFRVKLYQ
ncbi:MAG: hypothetical protein HY671_04990 [Chloroflexi bacterium]|nr:hypothetical protein [Chloroflexota bacterium]